MFIRRPHMNRRGVGDDEGGESAPAVPPRTLVVDTLIVDGNWDEPANIQHTDGTAQGFDFFAFAPGAGGTTAVGGGGGGAAGRKKVIGSGGGTNHPVAGLAGAAANANATDVTLDTNVCVIKGGLSGGNGRTGGQAGACTADQAFNGGDGTAGVGNAAGGASAGSAGAATGATPGTPDGGFGQTDAIGRYPGSGGGSSGTQGRAGSRGEARFTYTVEATPGYARCTGRVVLRDAADTTTRDVVLPPGGPGAGVKYLVVVISDGIPSITMHASWTALAQQNEATNQACERAFLFDASSADPTQLTVTTSASESTEIRVWRLENAGAIEWTTGQASSTNPDPVTHTPSGGSAKYLWIAIAGWDFTTAITGFPSGYSSAISQGSIGTAGVMMSTCERFNEAASENPGPWTATTEQHIVACISVAPAA